MMPTTINLGEPSRSLSFRISIYKTYTSHIRFDQHRQVKFGSPFALELVTETPLPGYYYIIAQIIIVSK